MRDGERRPYPKDHTRRRLVAGIACVTAGAMTWASQAVPAAHINSQLCFSLVLWLAALGAVGVDSTIHSRDPQRTSRLLALAVSLRRTDRRSRREIPARETVHRASGPIAIAAWLTVAAVHALAAAGAWHFYGTNFRLFTLFGLAVAARATVIRILGPAAAQDAAAESSALAAARIAREHEQRPPVQHHQPQAARRNTAR